MPFARTVDRFLAGAGQCFYRSAVLFAQITAIVDPQPHAATWNMALDEALLRQATEPTLRVYRWIRPAVSFGYFGEFARAHERAQGRELVRRWTGGGLVEHGEDLTYTLVVPRDAEFFRHPALESYRLIHERIAAWLAGIGIVSAVAANAVAGTPGACFQGHVQHDLVAETGKVAGAAQRRTRWGLLHQGSIQVPHSAERGSFSLATANNFASAFAHEVQQAKITDALQESTQQIVQEKYATEAWLRKF